MNTRILNAALAAVIATTLAACGGGGASSSQATPPPVTGQSATVPVVISDASSEDWSTIGVKVLSISLTPQGGGSPVTVYTAPATPPMLNLAQLDQLGEILGNATIPAGTYTGAKITVAANQGDLKLTASSDPETGFAAAAGATIADTQVQVQGTQGGSGAKTAQVDISFASPLTVSANQTNALQLEFDLSHPAFIVDHVPAGAGQPIWAVNFRGGPVRHIPVRDITRLVLRHSYGTVSTISTDGKSIDVAKYLPTIPLVSPETGVATGKMLTILADATNGTLFYDVDAKTTNTLKSFSTETTLAGRYVRVAARYQADGSLVATRIWAANTFDAVFAGPEGHVLRVNPTAATLLVDNEIGKPQLLTVDANTKFFFRAPQNPAADATPIGQGPSFLTGSNLLRGFKVHASVVDATAVPMVAQTVEIQAAPFEGRIANPTSTNFTFRKAFATLLDGYSVTLPYIASATPNGTDGAGNAVTGFKYWYFAYPTVITSGANAVQNFVQAASAGVNFGGTTGNLPVFGATHAVWGDASNPTGWSAPFVVISPTLLPPGTVATGYASGSFTMNVRGGTTPVTIGVATASGSATLAYQVDRTNGVVTVSPQDLTTSAGVAALTAGLKAGAPVRVSGVPQADGSIKAYVLTYFTGDMPSN